MTSENLCSLLLGAIEEAQQTARFGSLYSVFDVTDGQENDLAHEFYQATPALAELFKFVEEYFLSYAHGDPTTSGLTWEEATRKLNSAVTKLRQGECP